jgi:hypothetical protein
MPERMGIITPINACGASSAGPDAMAAGRYGALNQEPQMSDSHGRPWIMAQNSLAVRIRVPLEPS